MGWLISASVFHIKKTVGWSAFLWPLGVYDLFRHFFPLPCTKAPLSAVMYEANEVIARNRARPSVANWNF
jgi:hypothetical protein